MYDIENSDIDLDHILTITNTIIVIGNKGTEFSFLKWRQYVFCNMLSNLPTACKSCFNVTDINTLIKYPIPQQVGNFWVICIKGEKFLIPWQDGCVEGNLRPPEQQDFIKWKERFWTNQPKQYKEAAKYILGRDINTGNPDIANQQEYDRIKGAENKHSGENYGTTAKDPEDDAL